MSAQPPDDCKEIFNLLSQYLDAELPPGLCREIEVHISDCAPCVEFVESLKKSIALCHEYQSHDLPGPLPAQARDNLFSAYRNMIEARKPGS